MSQIPVEAVSKMNGTWKRPSRADTDPIAVPRHLGKTPISTALEQRPALAAGLGPFSLAQVVVATVSRFSPLRVLSTEDGRFYWRGCVPG